MSYTETYPPIEGTSPQTIREVGSFPGGNQETFICRAVYDFTESHGVEVTIIPQYDPNDETAPDCWTIMVTNQAGGIPDEMTTLNEDYTDPEDAVRHIKGSLDRLAAKL